MSQERLETVLQLQATGDDVIQWATSERFDDFVQGFYVRVKIDKKDTWGIGRVEGVRLGAPYQLGTSNIKDCTKYLLVYRPPGAPLIVSLNDVSNEAIYQGELESWDANLAILQLPLAHKLDIEAAKCKREEMGTPEVTVKLRKNISPKHLDAHKRISLNVELERKNVKKIGDSIAMFERKAQEQTHSQGTIQRRVALIKAQQAPAPRAASSESTLSPTARDIAITQNDTPVQEAPAPKDPKPKSGSAIKENSKRTTEPKPDVTKPDPVKPEPAKAEPKPEVIKAEPKPKNAEIELPFEIKLRHVEKDPKPVEKPEAKPEVKPKLTETPTPEPVQETKPEPKPQDKPSKSGSGSPKSEPAPSPIPEVTKSEPVVSKEEKPSVNPDATADPPEKDSKSEAKPNDTEKSSDSEPVQETKPEAKPQEQASKSGSGSPKSEPSSPTPEPNPTANSTDSTPEPLVLTAKTPRSARTPRSPKSPKSKNETPLKATKDGVLPPSPDSPKSPNTRTGSSETVAILSHTESASNLDSSRGTPRRARAKSVESKQALEVSKPSTRPRSIELPDSPVPGIEPASPPENNKNKSHPKSDSAELLEPHGAKHPIHQTSPASTKKKGKLESVTKKITQLATQPNFSKPASDSPELPEKVSKQKSLEPKSPETKTKKGFLSKKRFIRRHDKSDRTKSNSSDEVQSPSSPVVASSGDEKDLAHIPFIADENEEAFLEDDVNSPKQDSRKPHSRSGSISISVDSVLPPQERKSSQDRLAPTEAKGPSSLSMPVHSVDEVAPVHTAPSRHKRTSSLELTVTSFPVENITGRDHRSGTVVLLGAPLLSRFSIPVSVLSDPSSAREWESKKMRSIEKQARLHDKEKTALLLEESAFREKFPLDSKEKFAALDREQFAERETMNRKIIQDKANLQEQQLQERRNLERVLKKAHEQATLELTQEHDKTEKRTNADFEKQITNLKKANRGEKIGGEQLLERLQQAHKAHLMRNHHTKELAELKLVHKHELENLKKRQELLKRQTQAAQKLERDILIRQLSLSQKLLRQKRWLSLDLLREEQNTLRSFQERRHQLEIRQESELAQVAFKLIQKQQVLESATITKHQSSAKKKESAEYQKSKRALKANHLQAVRKVQKDKSLTREDLKAKLDDLQLKFKQELETLATQHGANSPNATQGSDASSISPEKIASRHEEQLEWFKEERKRRRDLILLHHQTDKNALQEEIELARKALESQLKSSIKEFEEEEITMKETFTVANENALWELQQLQWREIQETQKSAHDQQQKVLARMQDEIKATPYVDEEERTQAEEQMNVEQLQLEKQQEQEMLILEQERVQEQEQLKVQLEEEKKEVMSVRIVEDELTLRQEYIRKISNDTGLSEELIAKQLDIIGMPSFMF